MHNLRKFLTSNVRLRIHITFFITVYISFCCHSRKVRLSPFRNGTAVIETGKAAIIRRFEYQYTSKCGKHFFTCDISFRLHCACTLSLHSFHLYSFCNVFIIPCTGSHIRVRRNICNRFRTKSTRYDCCKFCTGQIVLRFDFRIIYTNQQSVVYRRSHSLF